MRRKTLKRRKLPPLEWGSETFGQRLARIRREKELTQVQLAQRIGITQSRLSGYELGRLRLHAEMIVRFALALRVRPDELLGFAQSREPNGTPQVPRRLLKRLRHVEQLPRRDQDALLRTLDMFIASVPGAASPATD